MKLHLRSNPLPAHNESARRQKTARHLPIEVLEARIAPATILNFNGTGSVVVDLAAHTITDSAAPGSPVDFTGADVIKIGAAAALMIQGTTGADGLTYTPTGANSGSVTADGAHPLIQFTGVAGAFTIDSRGGGDVVTIAGSSLNNAIVATGGATPTVQVDATKAVTLVAAQTASLVIEAFNGDDTLTVDSAAGAFAVPITYYGGNGFDTLTTQGGTATSNIYQLGLTPDAGTRTLVIGGVTQSITFTGLEPVVDLVAGVLTVNGNNSSNAITYTPGSVAANGLVVVDGFESIEFSNKTTLTINGLGGDDVISLNNPNTPTGLTGITVNGGDPSDGDRLIITGTAGTDTVTYTPTSFASGSLTGLAAPITFAGIESVKFFGGDTAGINAITINGSIVDDRLTIQAGLEFAGSLRSFLSPDFDFFDAGRVTFNGNGAFDSVYAVGTEGADAITVTGSAVSVTTPGSLFIVTLGTAVELLDISTLAGDDSVNLAALPAPTVATVRGGEGNDTLIGSAQADILYGGAGNDVLIGGAGVDFAYGEDGNDRFGDPAVADPGANDGGNDSFFGGAGSDTFVWDPGDGSDLIEGGEGNDAVIFNGSAGAETFTFNAVGTRFELLRSLGAIDLDIAGVEQANVNAGGGTDSVVVQDLFATELLAVNLNLGAADGAVDTVTLNGRSVADTLAITTPGAGAVAARGLRYDVNLSSAETADGFNVNGNAGHDTIDVAIGTAAVLGVTISGGEGDDTLSGDAFIINGNEGNDTLIGSAIDSTMDGGAGDDTFLGNGGTDRIGGGAGASVGDTILIPGTAGNDVLSLALDASGFLLATINGLTTTYTNFIAGPISTSGIERLKADGLDGADALTVDSTAGAIAIPTTFNGGAASDSLTVKLGTAGTTAVTPGATPDAGGITSPDGTTNFSGIELATVTGLAAGANTLNAQGTNGSDTIALQSLGGANRFWVNDRAVVSFANFPTVNLNGLFGDDTFSVSPTGLVGVTAVNVAGGDPTASDELIISGTAAAETFTFAGTSPSAGTVTITGAVPVGYTGTEDVLLDGLAGADTFLVASANGRAHLRGGEGSDTIDFTGAASGVIVDLDAVGVAQTVNPTGEIVVLGDVIENFIGTAFNDVLRVKAAPFARTLFGGAEAVVPPGDTLILDGAGAVVNTLVVDADTGTFKAVGYADVAYDEFETKSIVNSPSGPGGFGTPGNSDAFSTAHVYDSLLFKIGGKPAPGKSPTAVATGDLNGDGFADLVVANSKSKNISVLINLGDGTFLDPVNLSTGKASPQDVVLGDFDGDANLDAVVSLPTAGAISFFKGDGAGGFAAPTTTLTPKFKPFALATGDINGDGDLDLVAVAKATSSVAVITGNGAGVFAPGAPVKTLGKNSADVVVADFNGDGDLDVATANVSSNNISFMAGDGTGALGAPARFATGTQPTSLAAADLDSDGDLDLAVSNAVSRFVSVLLSNGAAPAATQFAPQLRVAVPGLHQSSSIVAGDFDGDGIVDLGLGNRADVNFTVLRGLGAGAYSQPYEFSLGKDPASAVTGGIALADFNNDGLLDIVATSIARSDVRVLLHKV